MQSKRFFTARNIAFLAVLVALIVVLQLWGGNIRIGGTPLSFVLVPIVIGAVMLGPGAGALLGFLFGVITIVMAIPNMVFGFFGMNVTLPLAGAGGGTWILPTVITVVACVGAAYIFKRKGLWR